LGSTLWRFEQQALVRPRDAFLTCPVLGKRPQAREAGHCSRGARSRRFGAPHVARELLGQPIGLGVGNRS
jgi:hypothetical protein